MSVVVTGASRGFGKAVAEVLCEGLRGEGGHDVRAVITARTKAALKSTHDKLKPFTTGACVCVCVCFVCFLRWLMPFQCAHTCPTWLWRSTECVLLEGDLSDSSTVKSLTEQMLDAVRCLCVAKRKEACQWLCSVTDDVYTLLLIQNLLPLPFSLPLVLPGQD